MSIKKEIKNIDKLIAKNKDLESLLTDEQCNEFRREPGSFNHMVRVIYKAGMDKKKDTIIHKTGSQRK